MNKPTLRTALLAIASLMASSLVLAVAPAAAETSYFCDFDGAGGSDLAVGVPREDAFDADRRLVDNVGAVHEFQSRDGQLVAQSTWTAINETDQRNGESLICADFNGDDFDDLAIGIPYKDAGRRTDVGRVDVIYGGPNGLLGGALPVQVLSQDSPGIRDRAEASDVFGFDMTWCDFDRDGFADLAVGVPGERIAGRQNAGAVHIIYGSANGLGARDQIIHQNQRFMANRAQRDDFFGEYLTAVPIDGDQYCDLVVGIPSEDIGGLTDAGAVQVVFGGPSGLTARNQFIHRNSRGVNRRAVASERFGAPLFFGRFRPSRGFEIVVGVPGQTVAGRARAGAVHVLAANNRGLTGRGDFVVTQNSRGIRGRSQTDDQFGRSVIVGRFDGDDFDDLAVGVPGERVARQPNAGQVRVIFGNGRGLTRRDRIIDQRTLGISAQRGSFFGATLSAGDYDADGRTDIAIGVPSADWRIDGRRRPDGGAVHVVRGGRSGLRGDGEQLLSQELFTIDDGVSGVQACDNFGNFNPGLTLAPPPGVVHPRCDQRSREVDTTPGGPVLEGPMMPTDGAQLPPPNVFRYAAGR